MTIRDQLHPTVQPLVDRVARTLANLAPEHRRSVVNAMLEDSAELTTVLMALGYESAEALHVERQLVCAAVLEELRLLNPNPSPPAVTELPPQYWPDVEATAESMLRSGRMADRAFRDAELFRVYDQMFRRGLQDTGCHESASAIAAAACELLKTILLTARAENTELDGVTLH